MRAPSELQEPPAQEFACTGARLSDPPAQEHSTAQLQLRRPLTFYSSAMRTTLTVASSAHPSWSDVLPMHMASQERHCVRLTGALELWRGKGLEIQLQ
jgi:hypothetical protein